MKHNVNYYCIIFEGGSLLSADRGICIVDNLASHKRDIREVLQKGTCS